VSLGALAEVLRASVTGRVETDFPLARLTTYKLGGPVELYLEPDGIDDLVALGKSLKELGSAGGRVPILAIGRGSNVVVSDAGIAGIAVRLGPKFSWIKQAGSALPGRVSVIAGASTPLPQLANWAGRRGLEGLEYMVSIPGSVGGAVRMNAGAHGSEVEGAVELVTVFDIETLTIEERTPPTLGFAYRGSTLGKKEIVLEARFCLRVGDRDGVRARMDAYRRHRSDTQPGALQNAGSVFKNPPGASAGRLVEEAGLKGSRIGGASVSTLHANFFIAAEGARAQDVYDLVNVVKARVLERFGVELTPEIRFLGEFEERANAEVTP